MGQGVEQVWLALDEVAQRAAVARLRWKIMTLPKETAPRPERPALLFLPAIPFPRRAQFSATAVRYVRRQKRPLWSNHFQPWLQPWGLLGLVCALPTYRVLLLSGNLLSRVEYVPGRSLDGFLRRSEEATFASRNFAQGTYLCVVIEVAAGLQSNAKPNCAQIFSSVY